MSRLHKSWATETVIFIGHLFIRVCVLLSFHACALAVFYCHLMDAVPLIAGLPLIWPTGAVMASKKRPNSGPDSPEGGDGLTIDEKPEQPRKRHKHECEIAVPHVSAPTAAAAAAAAPVVETIPSPAAVSARPLRPAPLAIPSRSVHFAACPEPCGDVSPPYSPTPASRSPSMPRRQRTYSSPPSEFSDVPTPSFRAPATAAQPIATINVVGTAQPIGTINVVGTAQPIGPINLLGTAQPIGPINIVGTAPINIVGTAQPIETIATVVPVNVAAAAIRPITVASTSTSVAAAARPSALASTSTSVAAAASPIAVTSTVGARASFAMPAPRLRSASPSAPSPSLASVAAPLPSLPSVAASTTTPSAEADWTTEFGIWHLAQRLDIRWRFRMLASGERAGRDLVWSNAALDGCARLLSKTLPSNIRAVAVAGSLLVADAELGYNRFIEIDAAPAPASPSACAHPIIMADEALEAFNGCILFRCPRSGIARLGKRVCRDTLRGVAESLIDRASSL